MKGVVSAMSANRNTFEAQSEFGGELPKKEILTAKADKIQDLALECVFETISAVIAVRSLPRLVPRITPGFQVPTGQNCRFWTTETCLDWTSQV
jgi:hypothetical protein